MDSDHLRADLLACRPVDPAEESHRSRMLDLLVHSPHCWSRTHSDPGHFTASAFVVDPAHRDVAMIWHRRLKRWLQPGGHVEPTDACAASAARRELREETGINPHGDWLLFDLDIHTIPARPGEPAHAHFDLRYVLLLDPGEARPALIPSDDAAEAQWMPLNVLVQHEEPGMARVGSKILAMLAQSPVD